MLKTYMMTRGSGLLILLFALVVYVSSKNYQETLLYGQSGYSLVETFLLITFYGFFKQIQQDNLRAKIYALLPLLAYYAVYEVNLLQFGSVIKFQDILLFPEFLDVLPPAKASGLVLVALSPFILIASNIRRKWRYRHVIYPAVFLLCLILITSINVVSNRVYSNLYLQDFSHEHVVAEYGPLSTAFIFENERKKQLEKIQQYNVVNDGTASGRHLVLPDKIQVRQNIHVIIFESFIDVRNFQNINLSGAYLKAFDSPIFKQSSVSLAPGFGNGTARSEFEILCGLPSLQLLGAIEFNVFSGERPVDCLPKILNDYGYTTIASHPYKPNYYNRIKAYKTLGFSEIKFADEYSLSYGGLKLDDAPGGWLYDQSLYEQNIAMLKQQMRKGKPVLNYVLTTYGHYPFARNETARPDVIHIENIDDEANRLLNQVYYRVEALKKHIKTLQEIDPEGLIVVVGDHLPPLTTGELMYESLGYSAVTESNRSEKYHETMVFVINNQQLMPLPEIKHHDIFQVVLNALYKGKFCEQNECRYMHENTQHNTLVQAAVNEDYIRIMKQGLSQQ